MWSGPRNISTALLRSWEARGDCAVSDEPLYAHYLSTLPPENRRRHPAWGDVLASQPTDWRRAVAELTGPVPGGRAVWYQKHMAHHLTPEIGRGWLEGLVNCFLVRDPAAMIVSFIKIIAEPTPEDLGLPQQVELFDWIRARTGIAPPVLDSRDVLANPAGMLRALCARAGVAFREEMLSWAPGPRDTDGVWAPHWYASVYASTGFQPERTRRELVPERLEPVLAACRALYDRLYAHRLTVPDAPPGPEGPSARRQTGETSDAPEVR